MESGRVWASFFEGILDNCWSLNGLFLFILLICDFVNDSFNTSTFTACCVLSSSLLLSADADENITPDVRIVVDILQVIDDEG